MIKNIVFDIGRVLVDYDWRAYLRRTIEDESVRAAVQDALLGHRIWDDLDEGILPFEEILEKFYSYAPEYKDEINRFWDNMSEGFTEYEHTRDWITSLKSQGYKVYYLSNWSDYVYSNTSEMLDAFLSLMDGGVFSYRLKMIKPHHDIYEAFCQKYNLKPEECVFLDDKEDNVRGAIEVGFKGIVVKNYNQANAELTNLLSGREN